MSENYYLTKDEGETFEEMSLEEIGRELLTHDGAKYDINVEFTLVHKKPIGGGNFTPWAEVDQCWLMNETTDIEKARSMLVEKFAEQFIECDVYDECLNIPDRIRAYDEDLYQEKLHYKKEIELEERRDDYTKK